MLVLVRVPRQCQQADRCTPCGPNHLLHASALNRLTWSHTPTVTCQLVLFCPVFLFHPISFSLAKGFQEIEYHRRPL